MKIKKFTFSNNFLVYTVLNPKKLKQKKLRFVYEVLKLISPKRLSQTSLMCPGNQFLIDILNEHALSSAHNSFTRAFEYFDL